MQFCLENISELMKCSEDPIYFIEKYVKIRHIEHGTVPFALYPYQKRFITVLKNELPVIGAFARQMGKTAVMSAYYLWKAIFKQEQVLLAIGPSHARSTEIIQNILFMYDNLPEWMQPVLKTRNRHRIEFDNHSMIIAASPSPNTGRGMTITHLWVDEAFNSELKELLACLIPCLSIYKESRITFTGTQFSDILQCMSPAIVFHAAWHEHPDRTQRWADHMMQVINKEQFEREYMVKF